MYLVEGVKRWKIFSREDTPLLEPGYFVSGGATFQSDAFASHVENPWLEKVTSWEFELKAGQFVIIPHGFPHAVLNEEDSIAIAGNFVDQSNLQAMVDEIKSIAASGLVQGEVEFAAALDAANLTALPGVDLEQAALPWAEFKRRKPRR